MAYKSSMDTSWELSVPQKDSKKDSIWIAESSNLIKLQNSAIECTTNSNYITIEGSSGSGKTFWIQQLKQHISEKRKSLHISALKNKTDEELKSYLKNWKVNKYQLNETIWFIEWDELDLEVLQKTELGKEFFKEFNLVRFQLPSLDKRKTEIPFFVFEFSKFLCKKWKRKPPQWDPDLLERIKDRSFSDNLNGLLDFVSACLSFQSGTKIKLNKVPNSLWAVQSDLNKLPPGYSMAQYEKEIIASNLAYMKGNREKTAQILGISVRNLYRKIEEYQLDVGSLKI